MAKPSWDDAPDWAGWLAQDGTGAWFWYERRPTLYTYDGYLEDRTHGRWIVAAAAEPFPGHVEPRP